MSAPFRVGAMLAGLLAGASPALADIYYTESVPVNGPIGQPGYDPGRMIEAPAFPSYGTVTGITAEWSGVIIPDAIFNGVPGSVSSFSDTSLPSVSVNFGPGTTAPDRLAPVSLGFTCSGGDCTALGAPIAFDEAFVLPPLDFYDNPLSFYMVASVNPGGPPVAYTYGEDLSTLASALTLTFAYADADPPGDPPGAPIPEPAAWMILLTGACGIIAATWRKRL